MPNKRIRKKPTNPSKLGERIKYARIHAGISQQQLAKILGVSNRSISSYEVGRVNPSVPKLNQIAYTVNRPITFFTEIEHPVPELSMEDQVSQLATEVKQLRQELSHQMQHVSFLMKQMLKMQHREKNKSEGK